MIKMHCDRCDKSEGIRWTRGKEVGDPVLPDGWGEVKAPDGTSSLAIYALCADCLAALHIWIVDHTQPVEVGTAPWEKKLETQLMEQWPEKPLKG